MTLRDNDLPPDESHESELVLRATAERLRDERPLPSPMWRGDLRRRLLSQPQERPSLGVTPRPWGWSALVLGASMLIVAAAGALGAGPLAPDDLAQTAAWLIAHVA